MLVLIAMLLTASAAALPDEVSAALDALAAPATVQVRFTQTQHREVLSRPLESTGTLTFARPDQLRWEVATPAPAVFVMRGAALTMAYPTLGVRESLSLDGRPELLGLVEGLTVWLRADAAKVAATYEVSVEASEPLTIALVPRDASIGRWLSRMVLVVADDGASLREVRLHEPSGDRVTLAFEGFEADAALPSTAFDLP